MRENEFEEGVDFNNDNLDDEFDEEDKVNPLVAAGILLVLIALAAIICGIVWGVTHRNSEDESQANVIETVQEATEDIDSSETEMLENELAEETQSSDSSDGELMAEPVSGNEAMQFTEVADTVTAKDVTNTPPVEPSDPNRITTQDGRVIIFTDCDDYVTPKEYVNLRVEPSTSQGDSTVKCQISHADTVHRTGYSADSGWSRVEYYGEVLYVVSSMVYNKEAEAE